MKIDIIKIGNSQGIRIPKTIMEQCGFTNAIEMKIENGNLILSPLKARESWSESFQEMAANGDDELLIDDTIPTEYGEEWEW
ncbi:AbrB/MazE/SpoVT family DNA-binding domain-containing protein [Myxosarcina sp. GI1]|uniref:AbrB/MazE/SpoVT family DNA-binding domain-containing protein n=1 Tax=Myxosarcina sp. GI1 TaxID=1541065 RepID=UPI000562022C|nr:peptidase [Myxosarcina sp. GI1]